MAGHGRVHPTKSCAKNIALLAALSARPCLSNCLAHPCFLDFLAPPGKVFHVMSVLKPLATLLCPL